MHLTDRRLWLQLKPKPEQWASTRQVIQHWDTTIGACCKADLPEHEFNELEKAVLFGDAMDTQTLNIIKRYPQTFHIGMIPDMRTSFTVAEVDGTVKEQCEADNAKWEAELRLFKGSRAVDQRLLQNTEVGELGPACYPGVA